MLVTFSCPAYANITLFGNVAIRLLQMTGHSGTVPGALQAEEVPGALARLQTALKQLPASEEPAEGDDGEPAVSIQHRALPLVELLEAAAEAQCDVMWERGS
ncbi:DUF1840 domain-containing protein [Thioalbus denitrificans]|uniref:Uncharacterized protein DUF1840 n=1 Tax=Thioalbus denitrificans TaxID=547122 RepID=A0A369CI16_9GAMM|nr:DUF1840 domain-containing protein [Thioalbus denitrificans]RCX32735.1 uncharacterized protein DUF1840 [Thioalbus denitrificans]